VMRFATLFVLFFFTCFTLAQNRVDVLVLDPFTPDTDPLIILVQSSSLPQSLSGSTSDTAIVGGERDLLLTATSGSDNSIITSGVSDGQWSVSTPHDAAGFSVMQYDGIDGSTTLNPTGLNGLDLTSGGADSLHCFIQSDHATTYTFTIYSAAGSSVFVANVAGTDSLTEFFLAFNDFTGTATFGSVGAIEIRVEALVDVDTFITIFGTAGPTSNPPPPPPPPGVSPSPVGSLWYTFDDDDEGVSPCGEVDRPTFFLADDNIIYYYFYGLPVDGNNPFLSSFVSGVETVTVSIVLLVGALFALI